MNGETRFCKHNLILRIKKKLRYLHVTLLTLPLQFGLLVVIKFIWKEEVKLARLFEDRFNLLLLRKTLRSLISTTERGSCRLQEFWQQEEGITIFTITTFCLLLTCSVHSSRISNQISKNIFLQFTFNIVYLKLLLREIESDYIYYFKLFFV